MAPARPLVLAATALGSLVASLAPRPAHAQEGAAARDQAAFARAVATTGAMSRDPAAQALARRHGLEVLDVTWEDTGRTKGSAVGPNISDLTIQVAVTDPRTGRKQLVCMPVIRFPNFADVTADVPLDRLSALVGNERGLPPRAVPLRALLANLRRHLSDPLSWKGEGRSLLAARDDQVLVSAQACFLPVPREGKAEFTPVLFNYQSYPENPAVLTILCTPQGTSVTIIDNAGDALATGGGWGQRLFFNRDGQRAPLTGERLGDHEATHGAGAQNQTAVLEGDRARGLDQVFVIQIPLKQRPRPAPTLSSAPCAPAGAAMEMADCAQRRSGGPSDVEAAVIGTGEVEGPFRELGGLALERDERFPIRVTIQFYKATSNGVVDAKDLDEIARQLRGVYAQADAVGSLVTEGPTGRTTEHALSPTAPAQGHPAWWHDAWSRWERETGRSREEGLALLRDLVGEGWTPPSPEALRDALDRCARAREVSRDAGGRGFGPDLRCGTMDVAAHGGEAFRGRAASAVLALAGLFGLLGAARRLIA